MKEQPLPDPRILKIDVCLSLSGRTSIMYHVGVRAKDDVCFRIWDTNGKGVFSKEWVCASAIQKVLGNHDTIAAPTLLPVFTAGRSVNTAGFLLAVLKHEGLVALSQDEAHKYVRVQSERFHSETAALIASGVNLDPDANAPAPEKAGKKAKRKVATPAWTTPAPASDEPRGE